MEEKETDDQEHLLKSYFELKTVSKNILIFLL